MSNLTWKEAIIKVLSESDGALHYREITEQILSKKLRKDIGATPSTTVNSQISWSIKYEKEKSPFIRVAKGVFSLRTKIQNQQESEKIKQDEKNERNIITSFGMFWRRDSIDWKSSPKLLGMQKIGAKPVDFSAQRGVYFLYDNREVIYVGRSSERPLGRRLYEHTLDRLSSARWDCFSWFGLLPVNEKGDIGQASGSYDAQAIIAMLEAVLIEALEPRQNRRRGDDLEAVEYLQVIDTEIEKRRAKELIDRLVVK